MPEKLLSQDDIDQMLQQVKIVPVHHVYYRSYLKHLIKTEIDGAVPQTILKKDLEHNPDSDLIMHAGKCYEMILSDYENDKDSDFGYRYVRGKNALQVRIVNKK